MSEGTTCETQGTHLWGYENKCVFCDAVKAPPDFSKENICNFIKQQRDSATGDERSYYAAVYFVLRNRTEENWGPKELTMDVAMGLP